jgi:hypothetical protein
MRNRSCSVNSSSISRKQLYAAVFFAAIACAPQPGREDPIKGHREYNVLPAEEMETLNVANAYEAIEKARPQYLRTRGKTTTNTTTIERAVVFLDGVPYGVISSLRGISVAQITVIQFYPGSDAVTRFGSQYGAGVIEVRTR